jgi:hypothetical protein
LVSLLLLLLVVVVVVVVLLLLLLLLLAPVPFSVVTVHWGSAPSRCSWPDCLWLFCEATILLWYVWAARQTRTATLRSPTPRRSSTAPAQRQPPAARSRGPWATLQVRKRPTWRSRPPPGRPPVRR